MSGAEFPKQAPKGRVQRSHEDRKLERGAMGWLFGMGAEKPANIAGFAIVVSFVAAIITVIWMPDADSFTRKDAVLIFVGIITLALGFLFGRGSASS
jgi:hypothetical protein